MKEEILKFFKGDADDSEETLVKYSHDASLLEVRPQIVLFPKDAEDVKNLVKWVGENKEKYLYPANGGADLSITPRCAGTDMSGGAIGESIILDFSRYMNKLISFIPAKSFDAFVEGDKRHGIYDIENPLPKHNITIQPGMFYRDFEKITLGKGLILPCYTASKSLNALGGMYGNNSAGERTLKYGKMEDYILSAKVVFADGNEYEIKPLNQEELKKKIAQNDYEGNVYKNIFNLINENKEEITQAKPKVHKNSAGYYLWNVIQDTRLNESFGQDIFDLNKLLVGSQGTLGIVTEMTLKLIPENKHSKLVAIFMKDLEPLGRLVDEILTLNPETLETYDDKTMKLAVRFFPDFLKNKGPIEMIKFMWSFLPEFFMMLTSGFPKLIILAEFAGENENEVNIKCKELVKNLSARGGPASGWNLKVHITKSETEANKYWDIRRESFALLRKHVKGMRTAPFIDDIIVRPEFLPKFLPELTNLINKYDLISTLAGHAGDGNFHIIPLMDFKRPDTAKIIIELGEKVYDLVVKYDGSITAEHNDGIIRTPYLPKMFNSKVIEIFEEIKKIFDPQNIFNPGKKVPMEGGPAGGGAGTIEYITSHIALEHDASHHV